MINHTRRLGPKPTRFYQCGCCARSFHDQDVIHSTEGAMTGIMAGLICGAASKNVLVGLAVALVGAFAGHLIDQEVTPKCPLCGKVLKVLLEAALRS